MVLMSFKFQVLYEYKIVFRRKEIDFVSNLEDRKLILQTFRVNKGIIDFLMRNKIGEKSFIAWIRYQSQMTTL